MGQKRFWVVDRVYSQCNLLNRTSIITSDGRSIISPARISAIYDLHIISNKPLAPENTHATSRLCFASRWAHPVGLMGYLALSASRAAIVGRPIFQPAVNQCLILSLANY